MAIFDSIANTIQGGANINTGGIFNTVVGAAGTLGRIIWYLVVFGLIGLVVFVFLKYNKKVLIKVFEGGQLVTIKKDMAQEVKDSQGKLKLKLFWSRKTTPKPENKFRYRIGKKEYYEFIEDDNGELHPIEPPRVQVLGEYSYKQKIPKAASGIIGKAAEYLMFSKPEYEEVDIKKQKLKIKQAYIPQERIAWMMQEGKNLESKIKKQDRTMELIKHLAPYAAWAMLFLTAFFMFKSLSQIGAEVGGGLEAVARNCLGG